MPVPWRWWRASLVEICSPCDGLGIGSGKEQAVAFAKAKNIPYEVMAPQVRKTPPKAYAANFAANRRRAYAQEG